MRVAAALAGLLLIGAAGGAALHFGFAGEKAPPLLAGTRAAIAERGNMTLEQTADYWLAKGPSAGDGRGSGRALALAIRLGRLEALRSGTRPVPDRLKRQFSEHYDDRVLDGARWTVAEPGSRLGRVLARWPVKEGAVTLGNVIVFKTRSGSQNRTLFAHELAHVVQYDRLGIEEFARRYARDPEPIEDEARAKARRVERSL